MAMRSVRFQSFLPTNLYQDASTSGALFSPTQAQQGKESAIHSIFSPTNFSQPLRESTKDTHTPCEPHKNPAKEIFFSPQGSTTTSTLGGSPFSVLSRDSVSSFKTIPRIEMLSLDYIQSCESEETLQHIVTLLATERSFPSLLRATCERLETIRRSTTKISPSFSQKHSTSFATLGSRVISPNSLLQTPSPSIIKNESTGTLVMSLSSDEEDDDSDLFLAPTSGITSNLTNIGNPAPIQDKTFYAQVQQLTQTIVEMEEARAAEQKAWTREIRNLEEAKHQAEDKLQSMAMQVSFSSVPTNELIQSLQELRAENHRLEEALERERREWETRCRQATSRENKLAAEIRTLQQDLSHADRTLVRKNHSLNQLLKQAQNSLKDVREERDVLITSLLRASGKKGAKADELTTEQRHQLMSQFSRNAAASKSALDAMAKALAQSENERRRATQNYRSCEAQLNDLLERNAVLEQDHATLTQQIQELSEELVCQHGYAERLIQEAKEKQEAEWKKREATYRKLISNLKRQLRSRESRVPTELYKKAVEEVKVVKIKSDRKQEEIDCLQKKVTKLQKHLKANMKIQPPTKGKLVDVNPAPAPQKENTKPSFTRKPQPPPYKKPSAPVPKSPVNKIPAKTRVAKIRAAGGRKGLQEKLKQIRSPKANPKSSAPFLRMT